MTINIALTSYPRRITNCEKVIRSVLDSTVLPDRIYLTLSHKEFPNYEQDLPQDLNQLIMTSNRVILNWVEENYKSMKKVFPILSYLEDDDIIIPIDDDMLVPKDLIEARLADFKANGCLCPISSNLCQTINMDNLVFTVYSLVQKKMLNGWQKFLTKEVLDTCNDDRTCLYLCHLNGYKLKPCTKWCYNQNNKLGVKVLPISPRSDYQYTTGGRYDNAVANVVKKLTGGKLIGESFGLFKNDSKQIEQQDEKQNVNTPIDEDKKRQAVIEEPKEIDQSISDLFQYDDNLDRKHDVVYVLGSGSKYKNLEIKISITSLLKFCKDWIGKIYIVGEDPHIKNELVHHLYVPDLTANNKDGNIIHKLYMACKSIKGLSQNFLFCSDDILVTKKSDWKDFQPRTVFEYNQNDIFRKELMEQSKDNLWDRLLLKTLDRFVGKNEHIYFYEPHIFAPINKKKFIEMCKKIDYTKSRDVIVMSLWFNWLNLQNPAKKFDHMSVFSTSIPDLTDVSRHLTYNDKAFSQSQFREWLVDKVYMEGLDK